MASGGTVAIPSASTSTAGVYQRAKRSTNAWLGARCACARSTRWIIRASVVSRRGRVTTTSIAPRPLIVPAKTSSPGPLSIGSDSPVTGAWLTWLSPAATRPSSGIFSPGFTMIVSPTATSSTLDAPLGAVAPHERLDRRDVHQGADRAARAVHAPRLQELGEREEEDDRGRLEPLADEHGPEDRDEHQDVDVERERPRGRQGAPDRVQPAGNDRNGQQGDLEGPGGVKKASDQPRGERQAGY